MQALRRLLILAALLTGTGALAGAQVCPGDDMYEEPGGAYEETFHGFADKHFDLSIEPAPFDEDRFEFTVEPRAEFTMRFEDPLSPVGYLDLLILVQDAQGQWSTSLSGSTLTSTSYEATYVNDSDEPRPVRILVVYSEPTFNQVCRDYSMQITQVPSCGIDDIRENDDSCFSATQLVSLEPEVEHWQISQPGDDDWFGAWLAPGQGLDVSVFCADTVADLVVGLYRANGSGCGALVNVSATSPSTAWVTYTNLSNTVEFVTAEVSWAGSAQGADCAFYSISYALGSACGASDIMEPNNDTCTAASVTEGVIDGASVHPSDPDYYIFTPAFEYTAVFAVDYDPSLGELDLDVYHAGFSEPCESYQQITFGGIDEPGYEEQAAFSGGGFFRFIVEVRNVDPGAGCIPYRLTVASSPPQSLGDTICFNGPNSTGFPSEIYAWGSDVVSTNSMSLSVAGTTPNSNGFFLASRGYGIVTNPGGAQGDLCITGAEIGRYVGPGQIQTSGSTGEAFLSLDLTQTPQPAGLVSVQPGESWFFQYWHR
ncbi:MAG: hypothetical protein AAGG01_11145, partial [Planctomycetota bacterium]